MTYIPLYLLAVVSFCILWRMFKHPSDEEIRERFENREELEFVRKEKTKL